VFEFGEAAEGVDAGKVVIAAKCRERAGAE
jgi:hypothetical protein